ncbi:hypothetical protein AKH08_16135 [Vibrio parahaemolyticus]|nr:hypothetical protein AKH08_16135 [Vibrio parahaemolyticus]
MNKEQLYLIAKLVRANTRSKAFHAAEDVLLNGLTQSQAKDKHQISKSTVHDAVSRYSKLYEEICVTFSAESVNRE